MRAFRHRLELSGRSPLAIFAPLFGVAALGGVGAVALAGGSAVGAGLLADTPLWWVLILCHMVAATAIGALAGSRLRLVLGAPLALVVTWAPPAFLPAVMPVWLRYAVGPPVGDCCGITEVISREVLAAGSLMFLAVGAACMAVLPRWLGMRHAPLRLLAAVVAACAALASLGLVHGRQTPVQARESSQQCTGSDPTVCWWSDGRDGAQAAMVDLARARKVSAATGARLPQRVSPGVGARWPETNLTLGDFIAPDFVRTQVVSALVAGVPESCNDVKVLTMRSMLEVWWARQLRFPVPQDVLPGAAARLSSIDALDKSARSTLFESYNAGIAACRPAW